MESTRSSSEETIRQPEMAQMSDSRRSSSETTVRGSMESVDSITQEKLETHPPRLNYSLRDRKMAIAICWSLVLLDSFGLAVVLFYALWFGTSMDPTDIMTIVTCLAGVASLFEFFWRGWILYKKDSMRPLGGTKWQFDIFQWIYAIAAVGVTLELVIGTLTDIPNIALCSMPVPTVVFLSAGCELFSTIGYLLNLRTPLRISSVAKGEPFRPGVYAIIEDVIAVEGHGLKTFRQALDDRYRASPEFRSMLAKLSLFWSVSGLVVAAAVTAVVWTTPAVVAFGIGWCVLFVWAAIWTIATGFWIPHMLEHEEVAWKAANTRV